MVMILPSSSMFGISLTRCENFDTHTHTHTHTHTQNNNKIYVGEKFYDFYVFSTNWSLLIDFISFALKDGTSCILSQKQAHGY